VLVGRYRIFGVGTFSFLGRNFGLAGIFFHQAIPIRCTILLDLRISQLFFAFIAIVFPSCGFVVVFISPLQEKKETKK